MDYSRYDAALEWAKELLGPVKDTMFRYVGTAMVVGAFGLTAYSVGSGIYDLAAGQSHTRDPYASADDSPASGQQIMDKGLDGVVQENAGL